MRAVLFSSLEFLLLFLPLTLVVAWRPPRPAAAPLDRLHQRRLLRVRRPLVVHRADAAHHGGGLLGRDRDRAEAAAARGAAGCSRSRWPATSACSPTSSTRASWSAPWSRRSSRSASKARRAPVRWFDGGAARGHQLLHLPDAVLHHRRLAGPAPAERNFVRFAGFVSFFPHLVAGPLTRHHQLIPQLARIARDRDQPALARRAPALLRGALQEGPHRRPSRQPHRPAARRARSHLDALRAWLGAARLRLPDLLRLQRLLRHGHRPRPPVRHRAARRTSTARTRRRRPATSGGAGTSRSRRWLRDYLYIPLGGNRCSPARTALQPDGRRWCSAASGTARTGRSRPGARGTACSSCCHQSPARLGPAALRRSGSGTCTFLLVTLGWVFFRAESFGHAAQMVRVSLRASTGSRPRGHARRSRSPRWSRSVSHHAPVPEQPRAAPRPAGPPVPGRAWRPPPRPRCS